MKYKPNYKHRFWSMSIVSVIAIALWLGTTWDRSVQYTKFTDELAVLQTEKQECGDGWYEQLELTATLMTLNEENNPARVEFLEGQLGSCNSAYAEEKHNRKYYQNALEDVPAYCSLGLNQFVIDGLRDELSACRKERVGAPCHSHPDGIHCGWGPCNMLYDCAFGGLGWIGPDREMCGAFGNTRYNEARSACYSDHNCSSCIQMTGGDLGHCYAFAYYP